MTCRGDERSGSDGADARRPLDMGMRPFERRARPCPTPWRPSKEVDRTAEAMMSRRDIDAGGARVASRGARAVPARARSTRPPRVDARDGSRLVLADRFYISSFGNFQLAPSSARRGRASDTEKIWLRREQNQRVHYITHTTARAITHPLITRPSPGAAVSPRRRKKRIRREKNSPLVITPPSRPPAPAWGAPPPSPRNPSSRRSS
jgi:hypothetical protein